MKKSSEMNQQSLKEAVKVNCTTTLFFARIGSATKEELIEYCEQFGPIKDISLMIDSETQKPKGCAFVKFMKYENAERCINDGNKMNRQDSSRKNWVIEWAKSSQIKEENLDKTTIYITNLNERTKSEEKIEGKFSEYGIIERITLVENTKGIFAFVKFDKVESAVDAINKENGTEWEGTRIVVEFSEAMESKRNRRQKATMKKKSSQNFQQNQYQNQFYQPYFSPTQFPYSPVLHQIGEKDFIPFRYAEPTKQEGTSSTKGKEKIITPKSIHKRTYSQFETTPSPQESFSPYQQMHQTDGSYSPLDTLNTIDNSAFHLPIFNQLYNPPHK